MTLTEMIALVRQDLKDEEEAAYRWTDDELTRCIQKAVKELSLRIPLEATEDIATEAGSMEVDMSSLVNPIKIEAVEYTIGNIPPTYQRFALWNGMLTLLGSVVPDGSDCRIYYNTVHILTDDGEDDIDSTIPVQYEELVAGGASGFAAQSASGFAIDQVNTGGSGTAATWAEWGKEKLSYFRAELKRLGHNNRIRVGQLYKPYYPVVSKNMDWGP